MKVSRVSLLSGVVHTLDLDVTEEALAAWKRDPDQPYQQNSLQTDTRWGYSSR